MRVISARANQILDSRGKSTIQIIVKTADGTFKSSAPSGASVGKSEVKIYAKNLSTSIKQFNKKIAGKITSVDIFSLKDFEKIEKIAINLGGNPVIALEYALLAALAKNKGKEIFQLINSKINKMPLPLGNAIGGGVHGGRSDIQEILFSPQCKTFKAAVKINSYLHKLSKKELRKRDKLVKQLKNDEGAWISNLPAVTQLEIANVVRRKGENKFKTKIAMGIDLAASQFYYSGTYNWKNFSYAKKKHKLRPKQQYGLMGLLGHEFELNYIEDPFSENSFDAFAKLNLNYDGLICADDLTCTNLRLLRRAIRSNSCNAVIIKPNQIGSLLKTIEFSKLAKRAGLKTIVSHRSGTTLDVTLAHLAVALQADLFKCGIYGTERVAKLEELIRLEKLLRMHRR